MQRVESPRHERYAVSYSESVANQVFTPFFHSRLLSFFLYRWGAFVVICGHFYLIAAGGMVALSNRSVNRALLLYPSNEEYLKYLEKLDSVGESFKESQRPKEEPKEEQKENGDNNEPGFFSSLFQRSAPPAEQLEEVPLDEDTPLDPNTTEEVVDVDTPVPSESVK